MRSQSRNPVTPLPVELDHPEYKPGGVTELVHGANTGPTIWALRIEVHRDKQKPDDQQKSVPYGVVLSYCEQVGSEAVAYVEARMEKQSAHLLATRVMVGFLSVAVIGLLVAAL
ncbi:hypothetical protein LCGC14_2294710 [marine sediment metagenome]|uniref:Uncharacterized protein n=1 Tax=marine sediment metagenome TaxID=412755 RepID=A0A0F9DCT0_9ZZZZ